MEGDIRAIIFDLDGVVFERDTPKVATNQAEAQMALSKAGMVYGSNDLLDEARDKYSLAGVTSMSRILQHLVFDKYNLHYYFDAVITADELKKTEPSGNPYVLAMQSLKDFPDQCVVIAGSVEHVYLARVAGCKVIAVSGASITDPLRDAGAERVVGNFEELRKLIGLDATFLKT